MELQPPILSEAFYAILEELISAVNIFAATQGYSVIKRQTKKRKNGVLGKVVLIYDRSKAYVDEERFARDTTSRKYDCPFNAVALTEDNLWVLRVREAGHNHELTLPGAHPTHRKAAMTQDLLQQISHQAQVDAPPKQTLSILRLDHNEEIFLFKARDVYNVRQKIREENLEKLLPVQALLNELTMGDEWFTVFHPSTGRLQRLFFAKKSSGKILRINWEMLLIDCTYKTNRYRMPLCIISGLTCLNISFYLGFAFLSSETSAD